VTQPLNAEEVRVAITGGIYRGEAPGVLPRPASAEEPLDPGYVPLGYVSEDGVTEGWDDSVDTIVAWQNATVVRAATTSSTGTIALTLIQTRGSVLETFHRGSTMTEISPGQYELEVKPINADPRSWVLDVIDGGTHQRIYIGNGEITSRGDVVYANGQPIGYPITISCYPDAEGNLMVKQSNDIAWGEGISGS
jgi:hypothetical protein